MQDNKIRISITENGDPLEDAIGERVNGILKEEYLNHYQTENVTEAKKQLQIAISLYNGARPHMSIGSLTRTSIPENKKLNYKRLSKNYYRKQAKLEKETATETVNQ